MVCHLGLCLAAWDSLGALLAASEGYGGPFGDYIVTLWLCFAAWGSLGALLAASEGYGGQFGDCIGAMLGSLGLSWQLLKAMVGHLETILGLCWAAWESLGALLAASEAMVGHLGPILGLCWALLGLSWGSLGGF